MSTAAQQQLVMQLLFDAEIRERFFADRATVLAEAGLVGVDATVFESIDRHGLELDAAERRRALMSALCRAYPLTAGALGAAPRGPEALASFLASPALFADAGLRNAAFGEHLARLIAHNHWGHPPAAVGLLESLLSYERGLVREAEGLRAQVARGEKPTPPRQPSPSEIERGRIARPAFFAAAELPMPTALIRTALAQIGPEDAWDLLDTGRLSFDRLLTVARADPMPVTIVSRALAGHFTAGGGAPILEVTHLTAELNGRRADVLAKLDGTRRLDELAGSDQGAVRQLIEAGLLVLAPPIRQ